MNHYDVWKITIGTNINDNEYNTSKKCCDCNKDLEYYKDKEGNKVFRLLVFLTA